MEHYILSNEFIRSLDSLDPVYNGPDKFLNGLKKSCTDPLFVYTGPAGPCKVLSSKQYTAICDRIYTVSYKRDAPQIAQAHYESPEQHYPT